jgi:hypothetical protein
MRPLNRPMFKMGGPVKEGIMDGIREPKANGGTIGGGAIVGEDKGGGRTGFVNPLFLAGGAITARVAPLLARARGLFGTNVARTTNVPKLGPPTAGTPGATQFSKGFPGPRLPGTPGVGPGSAQVTSQVFQPNRLSKFFTNDPILGLVLNPTAGGVIKKTAQKVLKGALTTPSGLLTTGFIGKGFLPKGDGVNKDEKGQTILPGQNAPTADSDTIVENKQGGQATNENQFNPDGTKKERSITRLIEEVKKRSKVDAAADAALMASEKFRTGEASVKDPSDAIGQIINVTGKAFDKDSALQNRLNLALIENELKKEQIAAQAVARDPIEIEKRKRALTTMGDLRRADKSGLQNTHEGTILLAQEYTTLVPGKTFRGSIGNDEALRKAMKNEDFQINEIGIISEKLRGGDNGLYIFGTRVYDKVGDIIRKI